MALIEVQGFDKLALSLEQMAAIPNDVKSDMLRRSGAVIEAAHKRKLESYVDEYAVKGYRNGKPRAAVRTGQLAASIKAGRPKVSGTECSIEIRPSGSRTRGNTTTRNEEIGYILEYGRKGVPARPWMRDANEECQEPAGDASAERYYQWLDEIGL